MHGREVCRGKNQTDVVARFPWKRRTRRAPVCVLHFPCVALDVTAYADSHASVSTEDTHIHVGVRGYPRWKLSVSDTGLFVDIKFFCGLGNYCFTHRSMAKDSSAPRIGNDAKT